MNAPGIEDVKTQALEIVQNHFGPYQAPMRVTAWRGGPLAKRLDSTLLAAHAGEADIRDLCEEAAEKEVAAVCVNTVWVPLARTLLDGTGVLTCTVIDFPLGAGGTLVKATHANTAVGQGAQELDMVLNAGALKTGQLDIVYDEIRAVVRAGGTVPVKVILETSLLTVEEIAIACAVADRAGASYVKTSTGFGAAGATPWNVTLMRAVVEDRLGVKASGGVSTYKAATAMIEAGTDRIGTSKAGIILKEAEQQERH